MNKTVKSLSIFLLCTLLALTANQISPAQETEDLQQRVTELEKELEELREKIPRIGYINRQDAFSVFPGAVEEERGEVGRLEQELEQLTASFRDGEIDRSEYGRQADLLRAKHLQAKINADLSLLNQMIEAKGFTDISDRLKSLKDQTKPMQDTVSSLIEDIEDSSVSPQKVSNTLNQVDSQQFKQLDSILTNLAQAKISQVARIIAEEEGYDLIVEMQNVVLYRQESLVNDITPRVKQRLEDELQQE